MLFVCILASLCLFPSTSSSAVKPIAECSIDSLEQGCSQSAARVLMQIKAHKINGYVNKDDDMQIKAQKINGYVNKGDDHTFEEACMTCQSASPGQTCFAGDCGDEDGCFCWTTQVYEDFEACSQTTNAPAGLFQDPNTLLSIDNGQLASHKATNSQSAARVPMQIKAQKMNGNVKKGAAHHHDTFEEACMTCQSASPGQTCFAGDCGDADGKFCWTTQAHKDFKACSQDTTMLLSIDRGHSASHKTTHSSSVEKTNVLGTALQACSVTGTAMTGHSRTGKCEDQGDDDSGSHHICIKMKSDFCTQTGQPNWCEEPSACMGQDGDCKIDHWCVCQWAFASYLQMAGGCDQIVDLVCEATNMAAFKAYEFGEFRDEPPIKAALACVRSKCNI